MLPKIIFQGRSIYIHLNVASCMLSSWWPTSKRPPEFSSDIKSLQNTRLSTALFSSWTLSVRTVVNDDTSFCFQISIFCMRSPILTIWGSASTWWSRPISQSSWTTTNISAVKLVVWKQTNWEYLLSNQSTMHNIYRYRPEHFQNKYLCIEG